MDVWIYTIEIGDIKVCEIYDEQLLYAFINGVYSKYFNEDSMELKIIRTKKSQIGCAK